MRAESRVHYIKYRQHHDFNDRLFCQLLLSNRIKTATFSFFTCNFDSTNHYIRYYYHNIRLQLSTTTLNRGPNTSYARLQYFTIKSRKCADIMDKYVTRLKIIFAIKCRNWHRTTYRGLSKIRIIPLEYVSYRLRGIKNNVSFR